MLPCPLPPRAGDLLDGQFSECRLIYFPAEIRGLGLGLSVAPGVRWSFREPRSQAPASPSPVSSWGFNGKDLLSTASPLALGWGAGVSVT